MSGERIDARTAGVTGMLALVCLIPFSYMPGVGLTAGSHTLPIGWIVFGVGGLILLLSSGVTFAREGSWPKFAFWTILLFGVLMASGFVAGAKKMAFSTAVGFLLRSVAVGWAGVLIGRDPSARSRFIRWISILGAVVAAAALFEVATSHYFIFKRALAADQPNSELWEPAMGFAAGAVGQPLPLSAVLNTILPLSVWNWSRRPTIARSLCPLLIVAAILLTYRRSAYLVMAVSVCVTVVLTDRRLAKIAILGMGIVLALLVAVPNTRQHVLERFVPRFTMDEFGHRRRVYQTAAKMLRSKPLLGIGTRQFEKDYASYADYDFPTSTPDSQYVRIAAENGIVGLAVFLSFAAWLFWTLTRDVTAEGVPFLVACSAFLLIMMVLDGLYWPAPSMVFLAVAGVGTGRAERRQGQPP